MSAAAFTLGPFDSHDAMLTKCIEVCRKAGLTVDPPPKDEGPWTTCSAVRAGFGCQPDHLTKALNHRDCPRFTVERSESGRILRLRLNPETSAWLLRRLNLTHTEL